MLNSPGQRFPNGFTWGFGPPRLASTRWPRRSAPGPAPVESPPALDDGTIVAIFDNANTADIETGKLAAKRGHSKEVRQFGAMLARDHAPGIGVRLDGWPNHELNPGAVIALSPALTAEQKAVYNSWGPGKYNPRFNFDGQNGPQVISPAYGLLGINKITVTGDGDDVAYWNRYVGVTEMHAHGSFSEPHLGITPPYHNGIAATLDAVAERYDSRKDSISRRTRKRTWLSI